MVHVVDDNIYHAITKMHMLATSLGITVFKVLVSAILPTILRGINGENLFMGEN